MKRFHFKLEKVLEFRRYHEEEWELKLAKVGSECLALENKIKNLAKQLTAGSRQKFDFGLNIDTLANYELYNRRIHVEIENTQQELARKELEREKIKEKYLEAAKDRKVMDKLKEKAANRFYKEQEKEEEKITDEISNNLHFRNKK